MRESIANRACSEIVKPVRDALYVLSGKWKIPIIGALMTGEKRFNEILKELPGITSRTLSKELQELEINDLVNRTVTEEFSVVILYSLTVHSESLQEVIEALRKWGVSHKRFLIAKCKE